LQSECPSKAAKLEDILIPYPTVWRGNTELKSRGILHVIADGGRFFPEELSGFEQISPVRISKYSEQVLCGDRISAGARIARRA
jgi:hypothetical protein